MLSGGGIFWTAVSFRPAGGGLERSHASQSTMSTPTAVLLRRDRVIRGCRCIWPKSAWSGPSVNRMRCGVLRQPTYGNGIV